MIKISDCVEDVLFHDDIAKEALKLNILNLSAYAALIQQRVIDRSMKPVTRGAIVVALSRLKTKTRMFPDLYPPVTLETIRVQSGLSEWSFEKTIAAERFFRTFRRPDTMRSVFFTITQGDHEITVIGPSELKTALLRQSQMKPVGTYDHLTAVTVSFREQDYIEVPNMIFSLLHVLAQRRVNIIEIVSTYTELSFLVRKHDAEATISTLSVLLRK